MEEAAQAVVDTLNSEYSESIVLARLFATVPFNKLPPVNQAFVSHLAHTFNVGNLLENDTLVLSLLGTRGENPDWNDRRNSQGHVGIPLVSESFIDKIPMMSRLLKEIGMDLAWINSKNTSMVIDAVGRTSGIFYVEDAHTATDQQNRKIIAAQDFVNSFRVNTAFGLAGKYATSNVFVTLIVFCREILARSQAALFSSIITGYKANTMSLVGRGAYFKSQVPQGNNLLHVLFAGSPGKLFGHGYIII